MVSSFVIVHLRDGAMAMGSGARHQSGRSHFFAEVVMCVRSEPIVAVDEGHEGEGFRQAEELQLLEYTKQTFLCKPSTILGTISLLLFSLFLAGTKCL